MTTRTDLHNLYLAERKLGEPASTALRNARIRQQWARLEFDGYVKLEAQPDEDYQLGQFECDHGKHAASPCDKCRKQERARVEYLGAYGIVGYYRTDIADSITDYDSPNSWTVADSVWGFIGDDWKHSGYDIDVMAQTIAAWQSDRARMVA